MQMNMLITAAVPLTSSAGSSTHVVIEIRIFGTHCRTNELISPSRRTVNMDREDYAKPSGIQYLISLYSGTNDETVTRELTAQAWPHPRVSPPRTPCYLAGLTVTQALLVTHKRQLANRSPSVLPVSQTC